MSIPSVDELIECVKVMMIWGWNLILLGGVMVLFGIIVLAIIHIYYESKKPVNPLNKYKNY